MVGMYVLRYRWLWVLPALLLVAACSSTPTGPSPVAQGPVISQGPLPSLIPQEPPPVPPRISATPPTALGATRFVAFGDSITYGSLSSYDGGFVYDVPSHSYTVRLRLALNMHHAPQTFTVVNAGSPGEGVLDGARRIQAVITQNQPQALLLLEGINDLANGLGVAATAAGLFRIVDTARQNNVTVLVATMPQTYETTTPGDEFRDNASQLVVPFNAEIQRLAASRLNVHIVDLYRAFGTNRSLIGGDGLHPTEQGHEVMASKFLDVLEAVFPIRGSFQ
jgi:lysophospholipase L1-like esterase